MMSKMKCFGLFAGCALASGALYATPTYSETFDSANSWSAGTPTASNYTFNATAGLPISGSALPNENKVLVIEGSASYTHGSALPTTPMVDMMVQTARPDDELGFPSSENTGDIQIAVAVDSNGCFNAYCTGKSGTVGWYQLSSAPYDASGWARVSFLFDYTVTPKRCQIRIDGQPVMSANGYLTASTEDGTQNGAWYTLANAASGVTSMKVIGCTAIDEVVMDSVSTSYPLAGTTDASGVPFAWYDSFGLAWTPDATAPDASGMTYAAKYNACLSPLDGQTFALKTMSVDTANNKMTVGIPATIATAGRQVLLQYSTDSTFATIAGSTVVTAGATTADVPLPESGAVYYCRLLATVAQ